MCCSPFPNRQPCQLWHFAAVKGQSKLFERIGFGTLTVMPPISSITFLNSLKSTIAMWLIFDARARERLDRLDRQRRPAELIGGVDAVAAVARDRHVEVARDREVVDAVVTRVGAQQHHRVGAVRRRAVGDGGVIGAEQQDRRRGVDEQAVLVHEGALGRHGKPRVGRIDAVPEREVARERPGGEPGDEEAERDRQALQDAPSRRLPCPRLTWPRGRPSEPGRLPPIRGTLPLPRPLL